LTKEEVLILGKTDAKDNPEMLYNGCERDKGSNARLSGSATWLDRFVPETDQVWLFLFVTVCIKKTQVEHKLQCWEIVKFYASI
jgi:hypothetical protein